MPRQKLRRYLRHGTLPQLRVFEAIARLGSVTRAAEELYLAQPTVSIQLKKLTDNVGVPLFEHIGRRQRLTVAGRALLATCEEIFGTLACLEDTLAPLRDPGHGPLRVAACAAARYLVPQWLAAFRATRPALEIQLQLLNRQQLRQRFADQADDLYLMSEPPASADVAMALMPNPLVIVARADHGLAGHRISLARLARQTLLLREVGSATRAALLTEIERCGISFGIAVEFSDDEAILQGVRSGLGIAAMSYHALGPHGAPAPLVLLDVEGFPLERQWHVVLPRADAAPIARAFADFLMHTVPNRPTGKTP